MSGQRYPRFEVWSQLVCKSGARLAFIKTPFEPIGSFNISGEDTLSLKIPVDDPGASSLQELRVIRIQKSDTADDFDEWRIWSIDRSDEDKGRLIGVECKSILYDLTNAGNVRTTSVWGVPSFRFDIVQKTPTEIVDTYVIAALPTAYSYFARGTIDPTAKYDLSPDRATFMALLRSVCEIAIGTTTRRPAELRARRNGTTSYYIDILTQIGSSQAVTYLRSAKNLRRLEYKKDAEQLATYITPLGAVDNTGTVGTIARAAFTLTFVSGTTYQITDPQGGPVVFLEDDQLNGMYVVPGGTNPLIQITDSAFGSPCTVTLASTTGITSGRQYELRADAANTFNTTLQLPSAVTTYGMKQMNVEVPEVFGIRNLILNPWFRTWSGGSPVNWTSGGTQETDVNLTRYGGSSVKLSIATTTTATRQLLTADLIFPRAVPGAQFFSAKVLLRVTDLTGDAMVRLVVIRADGGAVYGNNAIASTTFPLPTTAGGAELDTWMVLPLERMDFGTANVLGVYVLVFLEVAQYGASGSGTVYIDAVQLEQSQEISDTWIEFSDANALWIEGMQALSDNSTPQETYESEVVDLYRLDGTRWSADPFVLGATVNVTDDALTLAGKTPRIIGIPRLHYLNAGDTKLTLAMRPRSLVAKVKGTSVFGGVRARSGSGGATTGAPQPPDPTPTPEPPGSIGGAATRWEVYAGPPGERTILEDVPSAVTEVDTGLRRYVAIGASHGWTGRLHVAANADALLAAQYYRRSDATWRYWDGVGGPTLSLGTAGDILGTPVKSEADALGVQLCRIVEKDGNGTSDAEIGAAAILGAVVARTGTPPDDIPGTVPTLNLLLDLDASNAFFAAFTNGQSVPRFHDASASANDGLPSAGSPFFQTAGIYQTNGLGTGKPSVRINTDSAGYLINYPEIGLHTWYFLFANVTGSGSEGTGSNFINAIILASELISGAGFALTVDAAEKLLIHFNSLAGAPDSQLTSGSYATGPYALAITCDTINGQAKLYDHTGALVMTVSGGNTGPMAGVTQAALGNHSLESDKGRIDYGRVLCYSGVNDATARENVLSVLRTQGGIS